MLVDDYFGYHRLFGYQSCKVLSRIRAVNPQISGLIWVGEAKVGITNLEHLDNLGLRRDWLVIRWWRGRVKVVDTSFKLSLRLVKGWWIKATKGVTLYELSLKVMGVS